MRTMTVTLIVIILFTPWVADAQQPADTSRFGIAPKYEVRVELSVRVPMRDGVRLSTDLYFPVGAPEPYPVVLIRMPYNKKKYLGFRQPDSVPYFFASQGYVVAMQDMRGQWESEGEFVIG